MADGRSDIKDGKIKARKGRSMCRSGAPGREGALTGRENITLKKKREKGGRSTSVEERNVNLRFSGGGSQEGGTQSQEVTEKHGQHQLLPGLPDHITLDLITTKLQWTDLLALRTISRAWQHTIHTPQLQDARDRADDAAILKLFSTSLCEDIEFAIHSWKKTLVSAFGGRWAVLWQDLDSLFPTTF